MGAAIAAAAAAAARREGAAAGEGPSSQAQAVGGLPAAGGHFPGPPSSSAPFASPLHPPPMPAASVSAKSFVQSTKEALPLSPPLTPLPPTMPRFPGAPPLLAPSPYAMVGGLQSLLLAAQCNPLFARAAIAGGVPFGAPSVDVMENLSRLLQLRKQAEMQHLQQSAAEDRSELERGLGSPEPKLNSAQVSSPEDLRKEEEMVDDEMKEEEQQEDRIKSYLEVSKLAVMKKMLVAGGVPPSGQEDVLKLLRRQPTESSVATVTPEGAVNPDNVTPEKDKAGNWNKNETPMDADDSVVYSEQDSQDGMGNGLNDLKSQSLVAGHQDERKVRVRTLISEEQLAILKGHYTVNPRPKREELEKIAAKIGHPFKVVKVWFQNSRARDRREGKPVSQNMPLPMDVGPPGPPSLGFLTQMMSGQHAAAAAAAAAAALINNNAPHSLPSQLPLQPQAPLFPSSLMRPASPTRRASLPNSEVLTNDGKIRRSRSESTSSTESEVAVGDQQPLDLSAKGSSPSASPLSSHNQPSPPPPPHVAPSSPITRLPFPLSAHAALNGNGEDVKHAEAKLTRQEGEALKRFSQSLTHGQHLNQRFVPLKPAKAEGHVDGVVRPCSDGDDEGDDGEDDEEEEEAPIKAPCPPLLLSKGADVTKGQLEEAKDVEIN